MQKVKKKKVLSASKKIRNEYEQDFNFTRKVFENITRVLFLNFLFLLC